MYPTSPRASPGSRSGAGGSAGTGERLRLSERWGQVSARSSFVWAAKGAEAGAQTHPRLDRTKTKQLTRARGCRCGWTTLTRSTDSAWPPDWMSLSHRPTCPGTSAICTCDTLPGTSFGSAKALRKQHKSEAKLAAGAEMSEVLRFQEKKARPRACHFPSLARHFERAAAGEISLRLSSPFRFSDF